MAEMSVTRSRFERRSAETYNEHQDRAASEERGQGEMEVGEARSATTLEHSDQLLLIFVHLDNPILSPQEPSFKQGSTHFPLF